MILTGNPLMGDGVALFNAGHGNLGTAGTISETTLAEAYRLFGNQRGLEARQISVQPRYLMTIYDLTKIASQAWTVGQLIYWDVATSRVTNVVATNKLVGVAVLTVGAGSAQPIRVIRAMPDQFASFGEGRFVVDTVLLNIRLIDAPVLSAGDTVETHFLNQPVGRTYQYYCDAELGDARCGINLAAPSYSGSG